MMTHVIIFWLTYVLAVCGAAALAYYILCPPWYGWRHEESKQNEHDKDDKNPPAASMHAGVPRTPELHEAAVRSVAFEAFMPHRNAAWLRFTPWCWRIIDTDGRTMADGEGCSSSGAAIEMAHIVAREEFGIG